MTHRRTPPDQLTIWHPEHCCCHFCWDDALRAVRSPRLRQKVDRARRNAGRDRGATLVELLVVIVLLGIVVVPVTALLTTTLRLSVTVQRQSVRVATATSALSVAQRVPVVDACDDVELQAAVASIIAPIDGYTFTVTSACTVPGVAVLEIVAVDPGEGVTRLYGAREVTA